MDKKWIDETIVKHVQVAKRNGTFWGTGVAYAAQVIAEAHEQEVTGLFSEVKALKEQVTGLKYAVEMAETAEDIFRDGQGKPTCFYCGAVFGNDQADALIGHIEKCPQHPMTALRQERDTAKAQVAVMAEALRQLKDDWWDKHYPPDVFDGSSGDEGALQVVRLRGVIYQALSSVPKVVWHKVFTREQDWGDYSELDNAVDSALKDMSEIEVFVTECQPHPEQGQNSEQSGGGALQTGSKAETPSLVDSFAELSQLIGKDVEGIDDVVAWVREIRGGDAQGQ